MKTTLELGNMIAATTMVTGMQMATMLRDRHQDFENGSSHYAFRS